MSAEQAEVQHPDRARKKSTRRETIMSLVEMLLQHSEGELGAFYQHAFVLESNLH
jgi:hypothetical protein